jgi:hypothetical protein
MPFKNRRKYDQARQAERARWRRETGSGVGKGGIRYTSDEDRAILRGDVPDEVLAVRLGRSVIAIHARRYRLTSRRSPLEST